MTLTRRQFLGQAAGSVAALSLAQSIPSILRTASEPHKQTPSHNLTGTLTIMNRWSNPGEPSRINALFKQFEHMYPGVTIRNQSLPGSGATYQPAVRNAFASGSPPDLATDIAGPEIYALAQAGVIADLTAFYHSTIAPRSLGDAATEGAVLGGRVWGINSDLNVGNILWYNPHYLAKYGLNGSDVHTYTDWLDQLKEILKGGGVPIALGEKDQWPGGHYLNDLVQRTLGNKETTQLYNRTVLPNQPNTPKWTDPRVVDAFNMLVQLKPYFQSGFLGEATAAADTSFLLGQAAWHEMGAWLIVTAEGTPPAFPLESILFPAIPGYPGKQTDITIAATTIVVSKKANLPLAEAFLNWFTMPSIQASYQAINASFSPYKLDNHAVAVPTVARPWYNRVTTYERNAGPGGAILYNDEAINSAIYPKYIWAGSEALLSGAVTPKQLAEQLEAATVAFQRSAKRSAKF
jgi:raffinose/stachyose/melibiose transport system substrate-binding protein